LPLPSAISDAGLAIPIVAEAPNRCAVGVAGAGKSRLFPVGRSLVRYILDDS